MRYRDVGVVTFNPKQAMPGITLIAPLAGKTAYLIGLRGKRSTSGIFPLRREIMPTFSPTATSSGQAGPPRALLSHREREAFCANTTGREKSFGSIGIPASTMIFADCRTATPFISAESLFRGKRSQGSRVVCPVRSMTAKFTETTYGKSTQRARLSGSGTLTGTWSWSGMSSAPSAPGTSLLTPTPAPPYPMAIS